MASFLSKAPYRNFRSVVQARQLIPEEGAKTVHHQKFTAIDMASESCFNTMLQAATTGPQNKTHLEKLN